MTVDDVAVVRCYKMIKVSVELGSIMYGFIFYSVDFMYITEPGYEKMCLMSYAKNKGKSQTARISAFDIRCLDSIISLDSGLCLA